MTIFLAGREAVANALTWTLYLLSQNNKEGDRLYEEIDSVPGHDLYPTAADIPKLEYTEKVFAESMRLYPPVWVLGRVRAIISILVVSQCRIIYDAKGHSDLANRFA